MLPSATRETTERSHPSLLLWSPFTRGWAANDCFAKAGDGALGYIWAVSWGTDWDLGTRHDFDCVIGTMAKCKVFWNRGDTRKKLIKPVWTDDISFSDCYFLVQKQTVELDRELLRLDCILFLHTVRGRGGGKGNRRFMSFCDTRCSRSHVNGKWDV